MRGLWRSCANTTPVHGHLTLSAGFLLESPWGVTSSCLTDANLTFFSSFIILDNSAKPHHPDTVPSVSICHFHMSWDVKSFWEPMAVLQLSDRKGIPRVPAVEVHLSSCEHWLRCAWKIQRLMGSWIFFPSAKELQIILKYMEGCLVTAASLVF